MQFLKSLKDVLDNFDFEKASRNSYKSEIENQNNYSYWYPKVKDCGISIVKSWYYTIPYEIWQEIRKSYDNPSYKQKCLDWIKETVESIKELDKYNMYNLKNGCFSNKFNAIDCYSIIEDIPQKFLNIEYRSFEIETGGMCELVIRENIPFDYKSVPTIYNGLPLRPEFRIFVDFDKNKVLYIVNYWDYDYCSKWMSNATDRIIFEYMKDKLSEKYNNHKDKVIKLVQDKLISYNKKQKEKLCGQWSVDIMLCDDNNYYLIDMAIAQESAYWKGEKNEFS